MEFVRFDFMGGRYRVEAGFKEGDYLNLPGLGVVKVIDMGPPCVLQEWTNPPFVSHMAEKIE